MVGENRNEKEDWFQILCRLTMWGKSDVEALNTTAAISTVYPHC